MVKLVRSLGLATFAAGALLVAGLGTDAAAQVKGKTKDTAPAKTAAVAAGTIEIHEAKDGWRFGIKNAEGKTVAMSTKGVPTKEDVLKELDFLKATLHDAKPTEVKAKK